MSSVLGTFVNRLYEVIFQRFLNRGERMKDNIKFEVKDLDLYYGDFKALKKNRYDYQEKMK